MSGERDEEAAVLELENSSPSQESEGSHLKLLEANDMRRVWAQRISTTNIGLDASRQTQTPHRRESLGLVMSHSERRGPPSSVDQTMNRARRRGMLEVTLW